MNMIRRIALKIAREYIQAMSPAPLTKEQFICKAQNIFGQKYDYTQVVYKNNITPVLVNWINDTALPALKQHIKETNWSSDSKEVYTLNDNLFTLKASPNGSHGYMYLTATLQGTDELPAGKWSGKTIPEIGDTITAKINNLGKCYVLGYLLQDEWISIIAKPLNPPEWFIKQNGKSALVTLFGAEIE